MVVRVGVLGTGKIVRTRFLPAAWRVPAIAISAIGSRSPCVGYPTHPGPQAAT
jgi:predicted dehydrogenase